MSTLSAVLIVKNEAQRIQRCLEGLRFADEIVLLDTGSTDQTLEIASKISTHQGNPVKIYHQKGAWQGYGAARHEAESYATSAWVVQVDADEYFTTALQEEIQKVVRENKPKEAFKIPRKLLFFGRELAYGDAKKDWVSRLYKPEDGSTFKAEHRVHEPLVPGDGVALLSLKHAMIHDSYFSISHFFEKQTYYARLWSIQRRSTDRVRTFYLIDPFSHALGYFIRNYIFRRGFLDGKAGFLWASCNASSTFMKYLVAYIDQESGAKEDLTRRN